jgi:hypothetical protein
LPIQGGEADITAWLDEGGGGEHDAQDDDEDLRHDPLAQIDMVVSSVLQIIGPRADLIEPLDAGPETLLHYQ